MAESLQAAFIDASLKKLDCMPSAQACRGMNKKVYSGNFENCGQLSPFYLWKRHVNEEEFDDDLKVFMNQYKIDPFVAPTGSEQAINQYF